MYCDLQRKTFSFSSEAIMVWLSQHTQYQYPQMWNQWCKSWLFPTIICQHVLSEKDLLQRMRKRNQEHIDNQKDGKEISIIAKFDWCSAFLQHLQPHECQREEKMPRTNLESAAVRLIGIKSDMLEITTISCPQESFFNLLSIKLIQCPKGSCNHGLARYNLMVAICAHIQSLLPLDSVLLTVVVEVILAHFAFLNDPAAL